MSRSRSLAAAPEYFTTFQVARFLHVSPPTVVNWVNSGLLTAHRTPGGHRRIAKADIIAFARENDYPVPEFGPPGPIQLPLPSRASEPSSRRVLIVDDMPDFCGVLKDYLLLLGGFDVEVAFSGFAAGRTVERFKPEVILLDFNLDIHDKNAMDGFQLLDTLREDPVTRHIPVIGCTALVDARVEGLVRAQALVGCLQKPFPLSHLAEAVSKALDERSTSASPGPFRSGALRG